MRESTDKNNKMMDEGLQNDVYIPHIHDTHLDVAYSEWLDSLSTSASSSVVKVNSEKLLWNWQTGRDLVMRKAEEQWGAGVVEQLSLDLQNRFPGEKGFSALNLWYMKRWYQFYAEKLYQPSKEFLQHSISELLSADTKKLINNNRDGEESKENCEATGGMPFPELFALVPWRHHVEIITKCKTIKEASFYLHKVVDDGLSRTALLQCIKADL